MNLTGFRISFGHHFQRNKQEKGQPLSNFEAWMLTEKKKKEGNSEEVILKKKKRNSEEVTLHFPLSY